MTGPDSCTVAVAIGVGLVFSPSLRRSAAGRHPNLAYFSLSISVLLYFEDY